MAILTDARWESDQVNQLAGVLFLAISVNATLSVGVQLFQCLNVTVGTKPLICLWFVCSALFVVVVKEYFVVEQSYSEFRIESARITSKSLRQPPDVLLLTQLRNFIILASLRHEPNMSLEKIDWVKDVTLVYPSEHNVLKLATVLALNEQEMQALDRLGNLCNLYPGVTSTKAHNESEKLQNQCSQLIKMRWSAAPEVINLPVK